MVREFADALSEVLDSDEYAEFKKKNPSYYVAHGFTQLDKDHNQTKAWQVGFYSPKKDNLAMFNTQPLQLQGFEEAFKDGGIILELQKPLDFISTDEAMKTLNSHLEEKYGHEIPNSFLVILQVINKVPVYNITAITIAFSMITFHIDARSGDIIKESKNSILDLKKND